MLDWRTGQVFINQVGGEFVVLGFFVFVVIGIGLLCVAAKKELVRSGRFAISAATSTFEG
jgi:hypothetical protein